MTSINMYLPIPDRVEAKEKIFLVVFIIYILARILNFLPNFMIWLKISYDKVRLLFGALKLVTLTL